MNLYAQIINVIIAVYRDNISVFFYYILLKNNKEWGVRRYWEGKDNIKKVWGKIIERSKEVFEKYGEIFENDKKNKKDDKKIWKTVKR